MTDIPAQPPTPDTARGDSAVLTLDGVGVAYGDRVALRDVTLDLPARTLVGVLGPNGAGKSTLFRAILGLVPLTTGRITRTAPAAYVPQGEGFDPTFPASALDVALMGRYGHRRWWQRLTASDRRIARDALDAMGMGEHAACRFGTLSGGQRQRTVIARALAQERRLLLLDEPMTGVDATSQTIIEAALRRLRDEGHVIVMSTHDLSAAARLCDRLILLNGRVTADGPPGEALVPDALRATYGESMLTLDDDARTIGVLDEGHEHCGEGVHDPHGHDHAEHHAHAGETG